MSTGTKTDDVCHTEAPALLEQADMLLRLDGKVAVITGGASGIGQAIARLFAIRGASVHVVDMKPGAANPAPDSVALREHICDVTDKANVQKVMKEIEQEYGLDILVNSAGVAHIGNLENTTEEDFDRIYRVNVKGIYNCMSACVGSMVSRGSGVILNLASIAATAGLADRFAYSMSKGAVLAMTYSVAKDYIHKKVRCNAISPARVHTPFVDGFLRDNYPGREQEMMSKLQQSQPIGRMALPPEVAMLALFLCSDAAAFITGADYPIDGGFFNLRG